ncbi:MAG: putative transporter, partial [Brevibacillus sp.]|nr:putative transporter [Brevibacillus sp.]
MNTLLQQQTVTESGPFGWKAFQIYMVAILFYTTSHILLILVPISSHAMGAAPSQIGFIMGGYMFTSMFLRPVAGKIVDKFGVNRIFAAALLLNVLAVSCYAVQELWVFAVLRVLQGIILSFFSMILHLMIIEALSEKARGQGLSLFSLSSMLPYTYGPYLALCFVEKVPQTYLFLALIPIALTTLLIGIKIRLPDRPHSHAEASHADRLPASGSYHAWKDRKLMFPS